MCAAPVLFLSEAAELWPELLARLEPFRWQVERVRGGLEVHLTGRPAGECLCEDPAGLALDLKLLATEALVRCEGVCYWPDDRRVVKAGVALARGHHRVWPVVQPFVVLDGVDPDIRALVKEGLYLRLRATGSWNYPQPYAWWNTPHLLHGPPDSVWVRMWRSLRQRLGAGLDSP